MREGQTELARVSFGAVPHTDDARSRELLDRFCHILGSLAEVRLTAEPYPSPGKLASAFIEGRVQLAWMSPTLFVAHPAFQRAVPLVSSVRQGRTAYHVVLFTSERSGIQSIEEVEGRRVAWVAETSASGYLIPRLALAHIGLDPRGLFESETFHGSHGEVARAVLEGRADLGATFAIFEGGKRRMPLIRAGFMDVVPGRVGRILYAAGPIPADLMAAHQTVSAPLCERLTGAFQRAHEHEDARAAMSTLFGVDSYARFDPKELDWLRTTMDKGRAIGLVPPIGATGLSMFPR